MAVKYVKDFVFGPMTSVQHYAKGGHVTKVPAKAKPAAKGMPARAKPNAPAKGAKRMESPPKVGKGQGYKDGGKVPGKQMDRLPTKTPPGRQKDLAPAKPEKGQYQGYAEGGDVMDSRADYIQPSGGSPLDQYAMTGGRQPVFDERGLDRPADPLNLREPMPLQDYPSVPLNQYGEADPFEGRGARYGTVPMVDMDALMEQARVANLSPMDRAVYDVGAGRNVGLSDLMRAARMQEGMMRRPGMPQVNMYAKGGQVKGQSKVGKVMGEYKKGELHSGSKKGPLVKNPKQAIAIALSEARKSGAKIAKKADGGSLGFESDLVRIQPTSAKELGGKSYAGRNEPLRGKYVSREEKIMREAMAKEKQKDMERKMREAYERTQSQSVSGLKKGGMARKAVPTHKGKAMYGGGKC